jgi:hypothetical protein
MFAISPKDKCRALTPFVHLAAISNDLMGTRFTRATERFNCRVSVEIVRKAAQQISLRQSIAMLHKGLRTMDFCDDDFRNLEALTSLTPDLR